MGLQLSPLLPRVIFTYISICIGQSSQENTNTKFHSKTVHVSSVLECMKWDWNIESTKRLLMKWSSISQRKLCFIILLQEGPCLEAHRYCTPSDSTQAVTHIHSKNPYALKNAPTNFSLWYFRCHSRIRPPELRLSQHVHFGSVLCAMLTDSTSHH